MDFIINSSIKPLILPKYNQGAILNPSICIVNNTILINFRHINKFFYHSESLKYKDRWKNLTYTNDILQTTNYIGIFDNNFHCKKYYSINTSLYDKSDDCQFVGLEDCRLIYWNNKLYLSGTRYHYSLGCVGRIELSEIKLNDNEYTEISRSNVSLVNQNTDKNWMPILNQVYSFIKWSNPLEIISIDNNKKFINHRSYNNFISGYGLFKGGSQVISIDNKYIAIIHESIDNKYYHRFLLWDNNWNLIKISKIFSFFNLDVEFCCGMAHMVDDLLITFSVRNLIIYIKNIN